MALLRLSPLVPFSLSNYLYGLTSVRLGPYVATSWAAMLPATVLYVYLGAAGRTIGERAPRGPWEWVFLGAGLAATAVVLWLGVTTYAVFGGADGAIRVRLAIPGSRS